MTEGLTTSQEVWYGPRPVADLYFVPLQQEVVNKVLGQGAMTFEDSVDAQGNMVRTAIYKNAGVEDVVNHSFPHRTPAFIELFQQYLSSQEATSEEDITNFQDAVVHSEEVKRQMLEFAQQRKEELGL